ncbi:nucleoside phosphorylase domain-containing protein [Aspergillus pseudocaelatus]|uniref:Nucleoside phosphorylase domain-containing protein n=1 Tax=Aspergillus pseudocaelatus TaxID=1825620 RepID=A0ABQ6WJ02_9EURO|nr:nucleoside phosphorylase domain-containing protein [Aspergillus pseudocaelatus]
MAILDDIHPDLPSRGNDQNIYTLGSIGGHNIVIACLPMGKYGTTPAAVVGTQMLEQFPSVRFGLMVGIGGGIFEKGVRLGDVVVGTPGNGHPGVVQSDLGKAESTGFFPTSALNNPPNTLLAAVNKLIARRPFNGPMMEQYIEEAKAKWCHLSKRFTRPSEGEGSASLESIERAPGLSEKRQVNESVKIHYGLIASGNQVIKDEVRRDELNRTFHGRILCVEMEAAGLLYNFPCIVVRGICDYADSTKNDDWHDYAAIMAAAYAKELLQYVLPVEVKSSHRIKDILDQS